MNRANLEKLAAYLESIPTDYEHFSMRSYLEIDGAHIYMIDSSEELLRRCGTVACAVGHGPAAGIASLPYENWDCYSDRVFGLSHDEWSWCFSSQWSGIDDTPQGAAKRIRYMLEYGVPASAFDQKRGFSPYMFAKDLTA